jgi:hypothetical protein
MDDMDRQVIRAQVLWRNLRKLGVSGVSCACGESDPACFSVENMFEKSSRHTVQGTCANCVMKKLSVEKPELTQIRIAALEKRGFKNPRCLCGESHPLCLEAEHIDGQSFSDEMYPVCRNCHLKRTARQLTEHDGFWLDPKNSWAVVLNKIGGLVDYLEFAVAHLRDVEDILLRFAQVGIDSPPGGRNETGQPSETVKGSS